MVLEAEFPPDERVEKEIKSLLEAGFNVTIAVYSRKSLPEKELKNGYEIRRKRISEFLYKSSAAILLHPFYFRFWYRFLDSLLKSGNFSIIHIHDLPLSKIGYKLAIKYQLKLVCDQHEFYSNWIVRTRHYNTVCGKIIRALSNWQKYEKKYLRKADMILTVDDSLKEIYKERIGINGSKIITLPNTPSKEIFNSEIVDESISKKLSDRFVLFYAGGIDHLRGIDFVIECISYLKTLIPEVLFVIAGKENRAFKIEPLIKKFQVEQYVLHVGWLPLNMLPSYIAASDICLFVPRADNLEINNTIATKVFQYAALGKPVIVSEARKMKEFVLNNGLGFSVDFGDIQSFCNTVLRIYSEPEILNSIQIKAVETANAFVWEKTSSRFISGYNKLIGN